MHVSVLGWTLNEDRDNSLKESLTVSVRWVCQFSSLVVFFWRLLISAECRLQSHCQLWWKEERENEGGNCVAAKQQEFVIGLRVLPNAEPLPPDPCDCSVPLKRVCTASHFSTLLSTVPQIVRDSHKDYVLSSCSNNKKGVLRTFFTILCLTLHTSFCSVLGVELLNGNSIMSSQLHSHNLATLWSFVCTRQKDCHSSCIQYLLQ